MIDADHSGTVINTAALSRFLRNAQRQVGLAGEVNVLITSDERMLGLNREFRRNDKPTDVLAFPSSLNGKLRVTGDIAISAQIARANAEALGHPLESEIKILLLHGLLHLAGYDHESDNGEMARVEQGLRAKLKLPTGLIARTKRSGNRKTLVVPSAPGRAFGMGRGNRGSKQPAEGGRNQEENGRAFAKNIQRGTKDRSGSFASGIRISGAKAQKSRVNRSGPVEAVPFLKASVPKASSSVNPRRARRTL
jgi:probable rRNA maturation factor